MKISTAHSAEVFLEVLLMFVGNTAPLHPDDKIKGVSFHVRKGINIIDIWMQSEKLRSRDIVSKLCNLLPHVSFRDAYFKNH